jgi:A118 family predicted phage portal protein
MPNILTGLFGRLKNFIFPSAAAQRAFQVTPVASQTMQQNINLWYAMYIDQPPWATKEIIPMGIPGAICRELSRTTLSEFSATISGSARANFLNDSFQAASERFLHQLEIGLATGSIAFKPYLYGDRLMVDATSASSFEPTKFDAAGVCVAGVFREKTKLDGRYYVRLEGHDLSGTTYTIRNKAYKSDESGSVGDEVPLATVPDWADISEEVTIQNLTGPLFAYFKVPKSNNIDTDNPVGVSIYGGAAVDLIRRADEQWDLIRWEYKSGQRKIFMDATETTAKQFDKRLFECGMFGTTGDFFETFDPSFRDEPLYRGLQTILKQIEFQTGLSYGTISDPQSVEKTATEIKNSKQRMYVTVDSVQKALQHTFDGLIYAMDVYATLYNLAPDGAYEATYSWGDSVLDDADAKEKERANDRQDMASGVMNAWEYRAKWYGETEEEAKAALPGMEDLVSGE